MIKKKFISLVFPGTEDDFTNAFLPTREFITLDFPTLERPIKATWGRKSFKISSVPIIPFINFAEIIFIEKRIPHKIKYAKILFVMIKTISVFGDSLVYGMGDSHEGGWVSILQKKMKDDFIFWNFGIPGDTSKDLLGRIEEELKNKKADVVIIFIGANDSQYKNESSNTLIPQEQYKKNLKEISNFVKIYTDKIIFIGLTNMNESITTNWHYIYNFCNKNLKKYDKVLKQFCKENNFSYIYLFDLLNISNLSDGAHPNFNGYEKIADKVKEFLEKNILKI